VASAASELPRKRPIWCRIRSRSPNSPTRSDSTSTASPTDAQPERRRPRGAARRSGFAHAQDAITFLEDLRLVGTTREQREHVGNPHARSPNDGATARDLRVDRDLSGLANGTDLDDIAPQIAALASDRSLFPGDVLIDLAADIIEASGATSDPLQLQGISTTRSGDR